MALECDSVELTCGPRGPEWQEEVTSLPCPCGLFIKRDRLGRHLRDCPLQPRPLAAVQGAVKQVVAIVKQGADKQATCFCGKGIKTSDRDGTVAKALDFSKAHRGMSAGDRIMRRRQIFAATHVLVARTAQVARRTNLPLISSLTVSEMNRSATAPAAPRRQRAPTRSRGRSIS